ncbi:MAG: hypothetical protein HY326_04375 [Chloroflexi bacterium]|nr:hypothetical protein [Chloroflexota bacterium]
MAQVLRSRHPHYAALLAGLEQDVERLNRPALRRYLERRLQDLDFRIEQIAERRYAERMPFRPMESLEEIWQDLFELNYLEASREAMQETLKSLGTTH